MIAVAFYLSLVLDDYTWFECDGYRNVWLKDRAKRTPYSFQWNRADRVIRACERRMLELVPETVFDLAPRSIDAVDLSLQLSIF